MNKTLYLKDEDGPVWDQARELSGDKLSPVIVEALKSYVAERKATSTGFARIVVNYEDINDGGLLRSKAFQGKWLVKREENIVMHILYKSHQVAVAFTAKGKFVVLLQEHNDANELTNRGHFLVFDSIEEMINQKDWAYRDLARLTQDRHGVVPVEELDI